MNTLKTIALSLLLTQNSFCTEKTSRQKIENDFVVEVLTAYPEAVKCNKLQTLLSERTNLSEQFPNVFHEIIRHEDVYRIFEKDALPALLKIKENLEKTLETVHNLPELYFPVKTPEERERFFLIENILQHQLNQTNHYIQTISERLS